MKSRRRIKTSIEKFLPYNRYGKNLEGMEWLPLSGGQDKDREVFMVRFGPGRSSQSHIHQGSEEFLVLEGELTDDDGMLFQQGDFVRFEPGTQHSSYSEKGCTLLVITNKVIEA